MKEFLKDWKIDFVYGIAGAAANGVSQLFREETIHAAFVIATGVALLVLTHYGRKLLKKIDRWFEDFKK